MKKKNKNGEITFVYYILKDIQQVWDKFKASLPELMSYVILPVAVALCGVFCPISGLMLIVAGESQRRGGLFLGVGLLTWIVIYLYVKHREYTNEKEQALKKIDEENAFKMGGLTENYVSALLGPNSEFEVTTDVEKDVVSYERKA